jgi:hypothetical protein
MLAVTESKGDLRGVTGTSKGEIESVSTSTVSCVVGSGLEAARLDLRADCLFLALAGCLLALPCGAISFLLPMFLLLLPAVPGSVLRTDCGADAASPDTGVCSPLLVFFGLFRLWDCV